MRMRGTRILAVLTALLGAGLVSGSLTQVAALDHDLERAAFERRAPVERTVDDRGCPHRDRVPGRAS